MRRYWGRVWAQAWGTRRASRVGSAALGDWHQAGLRGPGRPKQPAAPAQGAHGAGDTRRLTLMRELLNLACSPVEGGVSVFAARKDKISLNSGGAKRTG